MEFVIAPASALEGSTWSARHHVAMRYPDPLEQPLVLALVSLESMVERYGRDYAMREGVAQMLVGLRRLLAGNWGDRLDRGTIDRVLVTLAERMNYNTEVESFND